MKINRIKKIFLIAALGVLPIASAWSQPPGPPHGEYSRRDGMRRPEGARDNSKRQLERFVMGAGFLEKSGKAKLSPAQAAKIVNLIAPWRNKTAMSEAQAKLLDQKLRAVLTSAQTNELKNMRPPRRDKNRRGGANGERRDEPPSAAQQKEFKERMEKMRAFMKTYNPFYPPTNYKTVKEMPPRMQERFTRRYAQTVSLLSQLANTAKR